MQEPGVVLITGTSRGIGDHLARHLLDAGWNVVGCNRSGEAGIEHARYTHHAADVSSEADVLRMFAAIRERHGRLDIAINNAGVNKTLSLVALTATSAAEETLSTNVLGTFLVSREAVKLMMRRRFGRIVNLGSMATRHEVAGEALYTASKAAINAMTRVLAKETAAQGITCNVVAPAAIATGLMEAVDHDKLQVVLDRNAITEAGSLEEVAHVVDWLIAPESAGITGQVIHLGGA